MNLVEEDDGLTVAGLVLGAAPESLPVARHRCFGGISGGVESAISVVCRQLQQQRGLADLARTGDDLDPAGGRFIETLAQPRPNLAGIGSRQVIYHSRIIILI